MSEEGRNLLVSLEYSGWEKDTEEFFTSENFF